MVFEDESLEEVLDAGTSPKSPQVEAGPWKSCWMLVGRA